MAAVLRPTSAAGPPSRRPVEVRLGVLYSNPLLRNLPRMTVNDAAGSLYKVPSSAVMEDRSGGSSGSAWPCLRLGCHWYCALPNVITLTGPAKELVRFVCESWNEMWTAWGLS